MGSVGRGRALFTAGNAHQNIVCGRAHQIGALALIAATFFLTRALDSRLYDIPIPSHPSLSTVAGESPVGTLFQHPGFLSWPNRGYGTSLSLKIYVYEESEVDGLHELMRGRDGKISAESCAKGQWGTQGDRTDKRPISSFHTWKDIIIPGNVDDGLTTFYESRIVQPVPLSKRKYLANFLGRAQGKVGRLQLLELAKQYPDKNCNSRALINWEGLNISLT